MSLFNRQKLTDYCTVCGVEIHKRANILLNAKCFSCKQEVKKKYRENNSEKIKAKKREYYEKNIDNVRRWAREYYQKKKSTSKNPEPVV